MASSLESVRAAVLRAQEVAGQFHTGLADFRDPVDHALVYEQVPVRVKKPRPSAFDAGNQTAYATKRNIVVKAPMDLSEYAKTSETEIVAMGLICQVATPDGDPTINGVTFFVESALTSQFAAEREINVTTEVVRTPRFP